MSDRPALLNDEQALALLAALDGEAQRLRTSYAGGSMQWRRWGSGPDLMLLHGGGGSWQHWVRNIRTLAAARTVWAPDLPGLGDSDDAPAPGDAPQVAAALAEGIDALFPAGGARLDAAGFSFGGIVGGLLSVLRPGRIGQLVIVGSTGLGLDRPELGLLPWRREADPARREALHVHNLRKLMMAHHVDADRLAVQVHSGNLVRARVDGRTSAASTWLRDAVARTDARVSGIWGALDATVQPDARVAERALRAVHPALRFELIDDAGHWVQYEAAERFHAALGRLLGTPFAPA